MVMTDVDLPRKGHVHKQPVQIFIYAKNHSILVAISGIAMLPHRPCYPCWSIGLDLKSSPTNGTSASKSFPWAPAIHHTSSETSLFTHTDFSRQPTNPSSQSQSLLPHVSSFPSPLSSSSLISRFLFPVSLVGITSNIASHNCSQQNHPSRPSRSLSVSHRTRETKTDLVPR